MSTATEHETTRGQDRAGVAEPTAGAAPEALTCPSCGAATDPGQLICLECGARLALGYQRAPSWRLPAAIVAVVVLLAGLGVVIALAAVTDDAATTAATAPTQPAPGSAPADTAPTTPQPAPAATEPAPAPAEAATPPAEDATATPDAAAPAPAEPAEGWPPGKSAFTVILASMTTREAAEEKLEAARGAGIAGAAILRSDDFPTLRPGYWVVFDGQYDTIEQATAQAEADRGKGEFGDAYPRFVSKNADAQP